MKTALVLLIVVAAVGYAAWRAKKHRAETDYGSGGKDNGPPKPQE